MKTQNMDQFFNETILLILALILTKIFWLYSRVSSPCTDRKTEGGIAPELVLVYAFITFMMNVINTVIEREKLYVCDISYSS